MSSTEGKEAIDQIWPPADANVKRGKRQRNKQKTNKLTRNKKAKTKKVFVGQLIWENVRCGKEGKRKRELRLSVIAVIYEYFTN